MCDCMPCDFPLNFDQWKTFSENYEPMRVVIIIIIIIIIIITIINTHTFHYKS